MTVIEMETMGALKEAARKYVSSQKKIDWEQRRYEIAKEVFASLLSCDMPEGVDDMILATKLSAKAAVRMTDELIKQLKETEAKNEQ